MISAAVPSFRHTTPRSGRYFNFSATNKKTENPLLTVFARAAYTAHKQFTEKGDFFLGFYDYCRRDGGCHVRRHGHAARQKSGFLGAPACVWRLSAAGSCFCPLPEKVCCFGTFRRTPSVGLDFMRWSASDCCKYSAHRFLCCWKRRKHRCYLPCASAPPCFLTTRVQTATTPRFYRFRNPSFSPFRCPSTP